MSCDVSTGVMECLRIKLIDGNEKIEETRETNEAESRVWSMVWKWMTDI